MEPLATDYTTPREIPLRARLYRYALTHAELAILQAILEGNSTGEFNFYSLNRVAAYAKLSRKTVQNTINGRQGRNGQRVPGLIEKRILVVMAPSNAAARKPTTYRIQLEACKPDPRMQKYLVDDASPAWGEVLGAHPSTSVVKCTSGARMVEQYFIGVDVGGTKVAAGLVDPAGRITHHTKTPMAAADATAGLRAVTTAIDAVLASFHVDPQPEAAIAGIGICAPGPLDPRTGVILNPPNLPGWRNFPLADEITKCYRLPVRVDNDGNAAALAEALWGAGRSYRNVFCATLGTGIGTGIVFDGRIYHGRTGAAAEGGHVTIDYRGPRCKCGKLGCIEILASGTAIARRAGEQIAAGRSSAILEQAGGHVGRITGEMVGRAYAAGDALAKELLQDTAMFLTVWLGTIVDLLEPDVMIVGGGVAALLQPFFGEIRERLPNWSVNPRSQEIPLVTARYGADAGIAGGAALCREVPQSAS